jgi:integrase
MPKQAKKLSACHVHRLKKTGAHAVGGVAGLYLQVRGPRARSWILKAPIHGKRPNLGLGSFPEISLEKARLRATVMREQIREGKDPRDVQRAAMQEAKAQAMSLIKFKEAAEDCWMAKAAEFKNAKHKLQWISTLRKYANPHIGEMYVQSIERVHVLNALKPIWHTKTETAGRVRGRIEAVIDYVHALLGIKDRENPAEWEGLKPLLPSARKLTRRKRKHMAALPWKRMPEFMPLLVKQDGASARCEEFSILTAARNAEARGATWDEIDMEEEVWTVPPERMKGGLTHRVPLSPAAMRLLRALPRFEGTSFLFPSPMKRRKAATAESEQKGNQLSENTLGKAVNRVTAQMPGTPEATPHGFRSSFKDWARSQPGHEDEVSELAIAHVNSDETRVAYARDELMDKRRILMNDWARFCYAQIKDNVVPIRRQDDRAAAV